MAQYRFSNSEDPSHSTAFWPSEALRYFHLSVSKENEANGDLGGAPTTAPFFLILHYGLVLCQEYLHSNVYPLLVVLVAQILLPNLTDSTSRI